MVSNAIKLPVYPGELVKYPASKDLETLNTEEGRNPIFIGNLVQEEM